jgi:xylulokinase
MGKYIIAHDLGTSGNKATLFTVDGGMKRSVTAGYQVQYANAVWAEQDPQDWWKAVCKATRELLAGIDPKSVSAVSFSGQMMGCVCVDKDGKPLRNAIIWADMRAGSQEKELAAHISPDRFYHIAGHKLSRSYSIEKLMWVRDNEPAIYERTRKMLNAKDYIVSRMTGLYMTDFSDASGTNALDLNTMSWSDEIIVSAGVDRAMFPDLKPSTTIAGVVSKTIGEECGLAEGTKIVLGGGDGSCASVGAGSIAEGVTYNCVGSSSWISTVSKKPYYDDKLRTVTWAHVIPGLLIPSGTMQTAAVAFEWGKERLYSSEASQASADVYDLINKGIENSKPGSNALVFLPYLLGERCPRWNSSARGSFIGLKNEHTREDMMRSIVEGIAMNLDIIKGILQNAVDIKEMLIVGGLARGDIEQQIFADVYGMDVVRLRYLEEATSIGAAVIAGVASGELSGFEDYRLFNQVHSRKHPAPENVALYRKMKEIFEKSYRSQLEIYEDLQNI